MQACGSVICGEDWINGFAVFGYTGMIQYDIGNKGLITRNLSTCNDRTVNLPDGRTFPERGINELTQEEYRNAIEDVIYLVSCAVNR